jgi:hypothetical protein
MIRQFFTRPEGAPAPRRSHRRRPALEALEGRALLSFVGPETRVSLNPQATDNIQSDVASSSNGTSVAVWTNLYSSSDSDIWAQRLDSNGQPTGAPIAVDFLGSDKSFAPRVAMDSQGRFAVTWQNVNPDGTYSVMMRYYAATGAPLTGITQVTAAGSTDFNPDVAASDGSIVITWTHQFTTADHDIYAERFVTSGGVPQGQGIFSVNIDTNDEWTPSVAMSPDGRFDIVYGRQYSAYDADIFASQYDGNGALVRGFLPINFDGLYEAEPDVAMDTNGNAVIVYERYNGHDLDTYANRLSSSGAIGGMINLQDGFGIGEYNPSVALSSTGQFVVAYGSDAGMEVVEVGSNDTVLTAQGTGNGSNASVSIDGQGGFVVTYTLFNPSTGHQDIFSRRDVIDRHFS